LVLQISNDCFPRSQISSSGPWGESTACNFWLEGYTCWEVIFKDDIVRTHDKLFTIGTCLIFFLGIHVLTSEIYRWPKQYPYRCCHNSYVSAIFFWVP
jgi:hypothetical protein